MVLQIPTKGWWETDQYGLQILIPAVLEHEDLWGPRGPAIVKAYSNGTTQVGWGLNPPRDSSDGFMPRYLRGEFLEKRTSAGYDQNRHAAAFVMRSARLIIVDIDGKNGGLQGIHQLGNLPFTLAETSKSGTGYQPFVGICSTTGHLLSEMVDERLRLRFHLAQPLLVLCLAVDFDCFPIHDEVVLHQHQDVPVGALRHLLTLCPIS